MFATVFKLFTIFCWMFVYLSQAQSIYRLPTTIAPIHYDLYFYPNFTLNAFNLTGNSDILVNITLQHVENNYTDLQSPMLVQVNMGPNMESIETYLNIEGSLILELTDSREYNEETEIVTIYYDILNQDILDYITINNPSTYITSVIHFEWEYKMITGGNRGIYISSYVYDQQEDITVYNAASSFGLVDARRGFPCWDEPLYKATFSITIYGPSNTTMISNTAIQNVTYANSSVTDCSYQYIFGELNTCKTVQFETTPIMSTYILAIIIGQFDSVSAINSNNVLTTVYTPLNDEEYGQYALDAALLILPYMEQLFNFSYELSKMDNIAVSQFPWGGMEDWGAVMYRKSSLLESSVSSNDRQLAGIVRLVSHEFAHQWFGNVVTNNWWDDSWLHEGFATFFGSDVANVFYPQLIVYSSFLLSLNGVMMNDASIYASTVIGTNVETYSDVMSQFGSLQYTKAGGVIRMLQSVMNNDSFYNALNEYLTTYQYSTATSQNLFDLLETYQINTGLLMESYTKQSGIPIINASFIEYSDDNNIISIELKQQRLVKEGPQFYNKNTTDFGYSNFSRYFDNDELIDEFAAQKWWIHLKVLTSDGRSQFDSLTTDSDITIDVERVINDNNKEYYLLNDEFKSYGRINYDDELFKMILNSFNGLSYWQQFNIIADRYQLMRYNYATGVSYINLLNEIIDIFHDNNDIDYLSYLVWSVIIDSLYTIDDIFCNTYPTDDDNSLNDIRKYAINLLKPLYNKLNGYNINEYEGENTADVVNLRNEVIMALIRFRDYDVIEDGANILNDMDEIINNEFGQIMGVNSSILQSVITASMAYDTDRFFNLFLGELYDDSNGAQQGYFLSSFNSLYVDVDKTLDTLELILVGNINNDGLNVSLNLSESQQISAINNLCECYGTLDVWFELITGSNLTDWEILFNRNVSVNILTSLISSSLTPIIYDSVYQFYYGKNGNLHRNELNERTVNTTLENIAMNTIWEINNKQPILDFIRKESGDGDDGLEEWEIVLIAFVALVVIALLLVCMYFKWRKRKSNGTKQYTQMGNYGATE